MVILAAPAGTLADHVVTLRVPSPDAGDVTTVASYVQDEQLEGAWLPDVPLVTAQELVTDWLDAWAGLAAMGRPSW